MSSNNRFYGFCLLVTAALVGMFAMSVDYMVAYVNNVIAPCQHDSTWQDGQCVCDNTQGIFGGAFCEECQCQHLGICGMSSEGAVNTRWSCRCPNHQKWVGKTCDQCYAQLDDERCHGHCIPNHYDSQCNTLCYTGTENEKAAENCSALRMSGGTCNTCNNHGQCTSDGKCECDDGWFTSRDGQQCQMGCGEDCPEDRGMCQSIGGQLQCVCYPGFFGQSCEQSCGSINDKPCSGHGTCQVSDENGLECSCDSHHIGVNCSVKCPGRDIMSTPCSGHGSCSLTDAQTAQCTCTSEWQTYDCSCLDEYTCNGRGACNPDYDGTNDICICEDHFAGTRCEQCEQHWWGSSCNLYCNPLSTVEKNGLVCHGHGSCVLTSANNEEEISCECQSNYENKENCATCEEDYYPKVSVTTTLDHCSVPCARDNDCSNKGECNPDYDGTNFLCDCDKNGQERSFDTLDPEIGCSACKPHWYPKDLDRPAERCTRYCAADGQTSGDNNIILFGSDIMLQGDSDAQAVCMKYETDDSLSYGVDANCHVCSDNGKCNSEGSCTCNDGVTGSYCEIDCGMNGREACSGHGRCIRDDLELWFDPNSNNFRCECLPYDTYTAAERQRLVKNGVKVEPPPAANYYGEHCDYHCPTYNSDICAGRGTCDTMVALGSDGREKTCSNDADCTSGELADTFCAVMSTPWDSLVPRFFDIGTDSPGYAQCTKAGASCIDTIYSVDWGNFCVQMLNGWYPNELNTRDCAFEAGYRKNTEDFFIGNYIDDKTWCQYALEQLTPASSNKCTSTSYPDDGQNFAEAQVLCSDLTLESSCSNDNRCVYDQTLEYILSTDTTCGSTAVCLPPCQADSNGVCTTNTYCRAKTCDDAIREKSIETLCFELDTPCGPSVETDKSCATGLANLRTAAESMDLQASAADLFFTCHMYQNSGSPHTMDRKTPGDISINGVMSVLGRSVRVQEYRTAALGGNKQCSNTLAGFCENHLDSVLSASTWFRPETDNWYAPWYVKCGEYSTVWKTETEATRHRAKIMSETTSECTVMEFGENQNEFKPWSLQCLVEQDQETYSSLGTLFPAPPFSGCHWKENQNAARWGQTQWSHHEIEQHFQTTCEKFSKSPVIPLVPEIPDYCSTYNPCGPNSECRPCQDLKCVTCTHNTIVRPFCNQTDIACTRGRCHSKGTGPNTYKCMVDDIEEFQTETQPFIDLHEEYKNINWLKHCGENTQSTFLSLEQGAVLDQAWSAVEAHHVSQKLIQLTTATLSVQSPTTVLIQTLDPTNILQVTCLDEEIVFSSNATTVILVQKECVFQTAGVYIVSSITIDDTETILQHVTPHNILQDVEVVPPELQEHLIFEWHPSSNEWGHRGLVTFNKTSDYVERYSASGNDVGLDWTFEEEENIRISGWLFLSSGTNAEMRLLSNGKALVKMKIETDSLHIGSSTQAFNKVDKGTSWCSLTSAQWIHWYIDVRYTTETHEQVDDEQHHHQSWKATVSAGECTLSQDLQHLSASHLRQTHGAIAHSFQDIASVSQNECQTQCHKHNSCLQWSWTAEDNHCYLYEKRCHEDETCVHGTHTLHAAHSHGVDAFVIDTDSTSPVTWAHIRKDKIVHDPSPLDKMFNNTLLNSGQHALHYTPYRPDTTAVCNDLAETFLLMPGYETRVCNGDCGEPYISNQKNMSMCGAYMEYKHPKDCLPGLNWTAYCYYKKSFEPSERDDAWYFPILGTTATQSSMGQICNSSEQFESDAASTCPKITLPWFKQCLSRWDVYEDFCSDDCLTHIEKQLSSNYGPSLCEKRKELLNLTISGDSATDQKCSKRVEHLIVTDFCLLQNAYHKDDNVLIPDLYMSDCPNDCTEMLSNTVNRSNWRQWCEKLSDGSIAGICSRTSCECDVEQYIGVDGQFCELTCPSGTENGIEVACSGRNGKCFAADFNQISADYNAQEAAMEYRGRHPDHTQLPLPNYEPIWLSGPSPSTTGICQCALGSGDSCSIPCDRCNNGTYGQNMASQYGICDAYFGLCRTLPPFMRYNVKYTGIHGYDGDIGSLLSYNTTNFEGIEWQNPERFVYADDTVLFEESVLDMYDYDGASYGIEQERTYFDNFRVQTVFTALEIFQRIVGEPLVNIDEYTVGAQSVIGTESRIRATTPKEVTNVGLRLDTSLLYQTYPLPDFPAECTKIQMSDWYLCFAAGQLHGMASEQMLVIESGNETLPKDGMTFARVSDRVVYAFGGSTDYSFSESYKSNRLYKITLRQQQWTSVMVVLADWTVVTASNGPPEQTWAPLSYAYNELYLLSTVQDVHTMFVLELKLDSSQPSWNSSYGTTIHSGPLVAMTASPNNPKILYLYIGEDVDVFSKKDGYLTQMTSPATPAMTSTKFRMTPAPPSPLECSFALTGPSDTTQYWSLTLGGNVMAEFVSEPLEVFIYLEEWMNLDTTSSSNILRRFYNTIEWRTKKRINPRTMVDNVDIWSVMAHVERLYMQQARWKQGTMLQVKLALYERFQPDVLKDMAVVVPEQGSPSQDFLNIVRQNDGSIFENEFVTTLPGGGPTLLYVAVEGNLYSRDVVISGHFREFEQSKVTFPYTEELKFQTGIIKIVVETWNTDTLTVHLVDDKEQITWTYSSALTLYLVIHAEEWMYHAGTDAAFVVQEEIDPNKQSWRALFNFVISKYAEPTHRMKKQMNKYLAYYGSHCSESADEQCPGTMTYTHVPCSGHGRCNAICNCECEVAPSVLQHNDNALDSIDWKDSPYRGDGCEITCPGFDGYDLNSVCTNNPNACQRDGTCACEPGYIGDACQFKCPFTIDAESGKERPCSNNGGCGTKAIELNSTVFTRDTYNNRLAATNRQNYRHALAQYYSGDCETSNYQEIQGTFEHVQFYYQDTAAISFALFDTASAYCSQQNSEVRPDLTLYDTHLQPVVSCLGLTTRGQRFYPMKFAGSTFVYPDDMTTVHDIFRCTYSDCVMTRHDDDKRTLTNVELFVDPPNFEIHGTYVHGVSSGAIIYSINGMKMTLTIEWTRSRVSIQMYEHFVYNKNMNIIDQQGEYKHFSIIIGKNQVKAKLYKAQYFHFEHGAPIWIAPNYGTKYRLATVEPGGYAFTPLSPDTREEMSLLHRDAAEYECDIEEDCIGIIRWETLNGNTLFSLYTFKTVSAKMQTISATMTSDFDYYGKMSFFYKGKDSTDPSATCSLIVSRQSKYPMVSFDTVYDIPILNVDLTSTTDAETGAVEIGSGLWTNCWEKQDNMDKTNCMATCQQQGWNGFASSKSRVCLCYHIKSEDIQLYKYDSDTAKTEYNPCDTKRRNNPQTTWTQIPS